jgi:hypothetical protein
MVDAFCEWTSPMGLAEESENANVTRLNVRNQEIRHCPLITTDCTDAQIGC